MVYKVNIDIVFLVCVAFLILAVLPLQQSIEVYGHPISNLNYPSFIQSESFSTDEAHVGENITITGKIQNRFAYDIYIFPDVYVHDDTDSSSSGYSELLSNPLYFNVNSTFSNSTIIRPNEIVNFKITLTPLQSGTYHIHSSTNPSSIDPRQWKESGPSFLGPGKTIVIHDKTNSMNNMFESNNVNSPLKQYKSGIAINEIQCQDNLVLIQKHDGSPACVKPETKQKLIERGWGESSEFYGLTKSQKELIQQSKFTCAKVVDSEKCK
ncbi:hypothetical protein [Nitrosopumilus ureiphilus]|uniref:Uncharacterized protein n=1 Tax=Nitrosopumilus ureiphilus TaxID=1470067 RepID=A0A7D5M5J5_9ARCH|nr:hypothetical protein [Nitrosopumilus ureiphilus]QLH07132.1 hypothetical protein C5F50_08640 [Nitrosopumilus ureiphilus]